MLVICIGKLQVLPTLTGAEKVQTRPVKSSLPRWMSPSDNPSTRIVMGPVWIPFRDITVTPTPVLNPAFTDPNFGFQRNRENHLRVGGHLVVMKFGATLTVTIRVEIRSDNPASPVRAGRGKIGTDAKVVPPTISGARSARLTLIELNVCAAFTRQKHYRCRRCGAAGDKSRHRRISGPVDAPCTDQIRKIRVPDLAFVC